MEPVNPGPPCLTDLPNEIILEILGAFTVIRDVCSLSPDEENRNEHNRKSLETLRSLTLSCRKLHCIATPLLYRSFILHDYRILATFARALLANPPLRDYVQYVECQVSNLNFQVDIWYLYQECISKRGERDFGEKSTPDEYFTASLFYDVIRAVDRNELSRKTASERAKKSKIYFKHVFTVVVLLAHNVSHLQIFEAGPDLSYANDNGCFDFMMPDDLFEGHDGPYHGHVCGCGDRVEDGDESGNKNEFSGEGGSGGDDWPGSFAYIYDYPWSHPSLAKYTTTRGKPGFVQTYVARSEPRGQSWKFHENFVLEEIWNCSYFPNELKETFFPTVRKQPLKKFSCWWWNPFIDTGRMGPMAGVLNMPLLCCEIRRYKDTLEVLGLDAHDYHQKWDLHINCGDLYYHFCTAIDCLRDFTNIKHLQASGVVLWGIGPSAIKHRSLASILPANLETFVILNEWEEKVEEALVIMVCECRLLMPQLRTIVVECAGESAPEESPVSLIHEFALQGITLRLENDCTREIIPL